jgi:hypothetical protein
MHPIWTKNSGWVNAENIRSGDVLESIDGGSLNVVKTETILGFSRTYNLGIDGVNTFFIVANGASILVHNDPPKIHYALEDMVQKGMHITSEGVELGVRGAGDSIKFVPVFSNEDPKALNNAIQNAKFWMGNDKWRAQLLKKTTAMTEALAKGTPEQRAASGSTRALEVSLERWCK